MLGKGNSDRYLDFNFGSIEVNLEQEPINDNFKLQIRDFTGNVALERTILFSELENK